MIWNKIHETFFADERPLSYLFKKNHEPDGININGNGNLVDLPTIMFILFWDFWSNFVFTTSKTKRDYK